jgi:hypothetical protein
MGSGKPYSFQLSTEPCSVCEGSAGKGRIGALRNARKLYRAAGEAIDSQALQSLAAFSRVELICHAIPGH